MPTISTSSPTFTTPRSTRPVTTVPRPEIENTSSIGNRNGLSIGRAGVGMYSSTAFISSRIEFSPISLLRVLQRRQRRALDDRNVVARKLVLRQKLANLHLDQLQKLRIVDHVDLVQINHDRRNTHLAGQKNVLARLRHRTVRRRNHQNGAVHLRRPGDHVLHVVGMPGAVHMRIVPRRRLVLDVRRRNRDAARLLLRRRVNLVVGLVLAKELRDRRRQRRLAMVNMTNRADVHMRLRALEFTFCHLLFPEATRQILDFGCGAISDNASKTQGAYARPSRTTPAPPTRLPVSIRRNVRTRTPEELRFSVRRWRTLERVAGIEPAPRAWKAHVIPFHHTRAGALAMRSLPQGQGVAERADTGHSSAAWRNVRGCHSFLSHHMTAVGPEAADGRCAADFQPRRFR